MIALDTTAIIDLFNGDSSLIKILQELDDEFVTTSINQQEIYFGLDTTKEDHQEEERNYDGLFNNLIIHSLELRSVKASSEIFWNLKKKGTQIGKFDCMIAGILLSNQINKIITKNVKHFEKIKELEVISY